MYLDEGEARIFDKSNKEVGIPPIPKLGFFSSLYT